MSTDPRQPTALEHARGVVAGWLTYAPKEEFPRAMAALDELEAEYDRENERLREALERIAKRGHVFDAKGTWSKEVCEIARAALAAVPEERP